MEQELTALLDGAVRLKQPQKGLRASMDTVMLATAVPAEVQGKMLDMGCGTGGVGLCVLHRNPNVSLIGVEVQPDLADLASENARLNDMADRITIQNKDVFRISERDFDVVITNPPYMANGAWIEGEDQVRNTALGHTDEHHVGEWIDTAHRYLRPRGVFALIYRADGLDLILKHMHGKFAAIDLRCLHPRDGETAKRVVIRAKKGVKTPLTIHPPLIMHDGDKHTDEAESILRGRVMLL